MSQRMQLSGQKFGRLAVISRVEPRQGNTAFNCLCDCGKSKIIYGHCLTSGMTKSCGCFQKEQTSKAHLKSILGKKFGRLIVIERSGIAGDSSAKWKCKCSCGKICYVGGAELKHGNTKSCGCLRMELLLKRSTKHGYSFRGHNCAEYRCWNAMKSRCFNKNNRRYSDWGGRGITVCQRWLDSFENFLGDMGFKPSPNHSLDRIDVNGNYEPSNCRWAISKDQCANRRSSLQTYEKLTARISQLETKVEHLEAENRFLKSTLLPLQ